MKIQEALSQLYAASSNLASAVGSTGYKFASNAASWCYGQGVVVVNKMGDLARYAQVIARQVIEAAKPYFAEAKNFVAENKTFIIVAIIGGVIGAAIRHLCDKHCRAAATP